jgi:uncharacterized protein (DUF58 family)
VVDWLALGAVMVAAAVALDAPGMLLVAVVTVAYGSLTRLWTRFGMRRVEYTRALSATRAVAGDSVDLDVTVWNRKPLPLPWVAADDLVGDGLAIRERPQMDVDNERGGRQILHNGWALAWYERVVRHFHLDDLRRGAYEFGPVRVEVRDILGRRAAEEEVEMADTLLVSPRTVAVHRADRAASPIGERRASSSLFTDPALFGGVRPFQAGDSLRRVHWRATARLGTPVSRRYEPARGREVVLVVDVQTLDGPHWQMTWDEPAFEELCIAAASLARQLLDDGASVGLAAASFAGSPQRFAWLAPQASLGQVPRSGQLLGRIGPVASGPLVSLLSWLTHRLPPGTGVVLLTARNPVPQLAALRRMARGGYSVELVTIGPDAAAHAGAARAGGLRAVAGAVTPSWEEPDAFTLAG